MTGTHALPQLVPDSNQVQPPLHQTQDDPSGDYPPAEAASSSATVFNADNSGRFQPVGTTARFTDNPSGVGIPAETRNWVDEQMPKKKTGSAIISLAKNRKRKDIADIERYVALLVKTGTLPVSGKRASMNAAKNPTPVALSTQQLPLPGTGSEVVEVLITEIRTNAQIRANGFDEKNVQRIMEDFDSSDPIHLLDRPEGERDLIDGYNRLEAAKRLGKTTIRAYIHQGSLYDGLVFAYKVNDRHGKPLTKDDRKHALAMIKATPEGGKLTGDQLAEKLGVSRQTIHTYMAELNAISPVNRKRSRVQPDEATARKKALATLVRFETHFGLAVFRDFAETLSDDQRAELRAMLDDNAQ